MNPITRQLTKLLKYFDKNQDILVLHRDLALSMLEYLQILCHNHVILKLLHKYYRKVKNLTNEQIFISTNDQVRKLQTIQELYIKFVTELESNHFSEWICYHPQTIGYIKECEIRQQKYAKNLERQFESTQAYLDHLSLWERLVL